MKVCIPQWMVQIGRYLNRKKKEEQEKAIRTQIVANHTLALVIPTYLHTYMAASRSCLVCLYIQANHTTATTWQDRHPVRCHIVQYRTSLFYVVATYVGSQADRVGGEKGGKEYSSKFQRLHIHTIVSLYQAVFLPMQSMHHHILRTYLVMYTHQR